MIAKTWNGARPRLDRQRRGFDRALVCAQGDRQVRSARAAGQADVAHVQSRRSSVAVTQPAVLIEAVQLVFGDVAVANHGRSTVSPRKELMAKRFASLVLSARMMPASLTCL